MKGGVYVQISKDMLEFLEDNGKTPTSCTACSSQFLGLPQGLIDKLENSNKLNENTGVDMDTLLAIIHEWERVAQQYQQKKIGSESVLVVYGVNKTNIKEQLNLIFDKIPEGYGSYLNFFWDPNSGKKRKRVNDDNYLGHIVVIAKDLEGNIFLFDQQYNDRCKVQPSSDGSIKINICKLQGVYKGIDKILGYFNKITDNKEVEEFITIENGLHITSDNKLLQESLGETYLQQALSIRRLPNLKPTKVDFYLGTGTEKKSKPKKHKTKTKHKKHKTKPKPKKQKTRTKPKPKKQRTRTKPKKKSRMGRSPHKPKK